MQPLTPGTLLYDRYRLVERIGTGGFGETWLARNELLDIPVAIKAYMEIDEAARERCLREARILASLSRNEGVVTVHDLVDTGERIFLVMEYLEGSDLADYLKEHGPLSLEHALRLLAPVSQALTQMHEQGLLHRDVSPDNILIPEAGSAKLIDFGSALRVAAGAATTIVVKPGYAPPEQYASPEDQGTWTDTYALAATIYQCLTGKAPMDALQRTFHDELPAPSVLNPALDAAVDAPLMHALALDYRARTQTPAELMRTLGTAGSPVAEAEAKVEQAPVDPQAPAEPQAPAAHVASEPVVKRDEPAIVNASPVSAPAIAAPEKTHEQVVASNEPRKQVISVIPRVVAGPPVVPEQSATPAPAPVVPPVMPVVQAPEPVTPTAQPTVQPVKPPELPTTPPAQPAVPAAQPVEPHKTEPAAPKHHSESPKKRKGLLPLILGAAALIVALLLGVTLLREAPGATGGSSTISEHAKFENQVVDAGSISAIRGKGAVTEISFKGCEVTSDAIEQIAKLPALKSFALYSCTSCESLEPLASNETLRLIYIAGMEIDGNKLFPVDFPHLENLTITGSSLTGDTSFFKHFSTLDKLNLSSCEGVSDITFLAQTPNLTNLELSGIDLSADNGAAIASCPKLTLVAVDGCGLTSIDWAASLPDLYYLRATGNALTDLAPLAGCTRLDAVNVNANRITSLAPLANCAGLTTIEVELNQLSDLAGLEGKAKLTKLLADNNVLTDVSALSGNTRLSVLSVSHNELSDLSPLTEIHELRFLDASYNSLENLDFCEQLIKMERLDVSHNLIEDVSMLASCARIERLALQDNQITDISALGNGFTRLEALDASSNAIESLEPLADCAALVYAAVYDNELTSLDGMGGKTALEYFLADNNLLTDISALSTSTGKLRYLDLGNNEITDVTALSSLFSQSEFDVGIAVLLDHNELESVSPLPVGPQYYLITLFGNPITDVSFLARDGMRWNGLYIPYIEDVDYAAIFEKQSVSLPINIVGAPYNTQAHLLDEAKNWLFEPKFLTDIEADALAEGKRGELHERVSSESCTGYNTEPLIVAQQADTEDAETEAESDEASDE